jgi:hypothetical protein
VRTTLTLDDDVAAKINAEMRRTGRSLKDTVNATLRLGLNARRALKPAKPFRVRARPLGLRPGLSYDKVSDLLDQLEGPLRR